VKEYGLECYSLFSMNPLRILEAWNYGALYHISFFSVLAYGQASFFLLDRSMPPFSKGFWGDLRDMTGIFIFEMPYLWVG